jgi:TatD DNase family protein
VPAERFANAEPPPPDATAAAATPLIDAHAHLDMLPDVDGALTRMREHGVAGVVTIGVDRASSRWAARTARAHDYVWATVGLHPHDAKDFGATVRDELEALARNEDRVVGVGEAGLDYFYDHSPREQQREVFAWHVGLANRAGKALVIHCRDAFDDVFSILDAEGVPERVVFHCWSGGPADAERALQRGAYLSFSGTVTFKNADDLRAAAKMAPRDRIMVETDAPFLTPMPYRGRTNEPAYVRTTARFLADALAVAEDELAAATTAAARAAFGL